MKALPALLSQTIQFLSRSPPDAVSLGVLSHVRPSLDRLVTTALPWIAAVSSSVSEETSQTPWMASYATDASVARSFVPFAPAVHFVIPGSCPAVQFAPLSVEVANPIAQAPPS